MYGFQSYISVPIRLPDGRFFGTLCSIDPRPARLRAGDTVTMFKLYADLIAMHLDAQERLSVSETALIDEREDADLREQFIAVLGHDLRNPLAAVRTGVKLLEARGLSHDAAAVASVIDRSAARMSALIDDILDFARARLGPGLPMDPRVVSDLEAVLLDIVDEARTVHPERAIHADIDVPEPLLCDRGRIGQLLANLLVNALTHGDADGPVEVKAAVKDGQFVLEVTNSGELADGRDSRASLPAVCTLQSIAAGRARTRTVYCLRNREGASGPARGAVSWPADPVLVLDARVVADAHVDRGLTSPPRQFFLPRAAFLFFCGRDDFLAAARLPVARRLSPTRSGNSLRPVSRFHSSKVSLEIFSSTRSRANLRLCA